MDYQKQALDFLNATSTAITIKFKKYGRHFADDKQSRNIYRIKIANKLGSFSFDFGQSIYGTQKNEAPSYYDVLACLTKYDVGSFDDFCSDFGYEQFIENANGTRMIENKAAKKTYNAVCKEYENVCKLWSYEQIEQLQAIN